MIITRTPYRISFFGGGTDYRPWYEQNGGDFLSTSINHYTYVSCRYLPPFNDKYRNRIAWRILEHTNSVNEIQHNAIREALKYYGISCGVEISIQSDLISRAGLGSSSVFCAGLIRALFALKGQMLSKYALAKETIKLEREILQEAGGIQDQIAVVFGGLNYVHISHNGAFTVEPIIMGSEKRDFFTDRLMLFFTGISRDSFKIASQQTQNIGNRKSQLKEMQKMVATAANILIGPESGFDEFGRLLHQSWLLKRQLAASISNDLIDETYSLAMQNGALGGKILGAGGGGFILFYVPPEHQNDVKKALRHLIHVPFKIDDQGSQTVFYSPKIYPDSVYANRDYIHLRNKADTE